jgi:Ferritin-like
MSKIQPRNLPAKRLERLVVGNPVTTRIEDGVANCFPGLEFDHRNLDRRFFPGLIFSFVDPPADDGHLGAHLAAVDTSDPALYPAADDISVPDYERKHAAHLASQLGGDAGTRLQSGAWYLASITQRGTTIELTDPTTKPRANLAGSTVWRMVRMLAPAEVTIVLEQRRPPAGAHRANGKAANDKRPAITLTGWRRRFIDTATGLLSGAYSPGELGQSLCSPWMHDFRDCACNYWAANHPDIVYPAIPLGDQTLGTENVSDPLLANVRVDWLRSDRFPSGDVQAPGTADGVRGAQIDHYEINRRWQDLDFVLGNRESSGFYRPNEAIDVKPFGSPLDLAQHLVYSASLEHVLALEYLYARYSVKSPLELARAPSDLLDFAEYARHELLGIAVGEMRHLRWANELLWTMQKSALLPAGFALPALGVATAVPLGNDAQGKPQSTPAALRNLDPSSLAVYVAGERPSGALDGLYSRVVATLRHPGNNYPAGMLALTEQIVADGVNHFLTFEQLETLGAPFAKPSGPPSYSRNLTKAQPSDKNVAPALAAYATILADLQKGYSGGDVEDRKYIPPARSAMSELDTIADALGAKGIGIPFF